MLPTLVHSWIYSNAKVLSQGIKTLNYGQMSITVRENDSSNGVHFVNFNQDYT